MPLGIIAVVGIGGFALYDNYKSEQKREAYLELEKKLQTERAKVKREIRTKIDRAKSEANAESKEWTVYYEPDPATGKRVARGATIQSEDDLCYLDVQKRLDGSELTGLRCPIIQITELDDIKIRFDIYDVLDKMSIKSYSNSGEVYIPSTQHESSGYMSYKSFIKGLGTANILAIKIPWEEGFWTRFNLKGSSLALEKLGVREPISEDPGQVVSKIEKEKVSVSSTKKPDCASGKDLYIYKDPVGSTVLTTKPMHGPGFPSDGWTLMTKRCMTGSP